MLKCKSELADYRFGPRVEHIQSRESQVGNWPKGRFVRFHQLNRALAVFIWCYFWPNSNCLGGKLCWHGSRIFIPDLSLLQMISNNDDDHHFNSGLAKLTKFSKLIFKYNSMQLNGQLNELKLYQQQRSPVSNE